MKGRVLVRLKAQVLDPQGLTIAKALGNLGYEQVDDVRQGKVFDIELATEDRAEAERLLRAMAEELLANPVIETFDTQLLDSSVGTGGDAA